MGPELKASIFTVRGPSVQDKSLTTTAYVVFNTSADIIKVTFKWINFTGVVAGPGKTVFDAWKSDSKIYGLFIDDCILYGERHASLMDLGDFSGTVSIADSAVIGYKSVLYSVCVFQSIGAYDTDSLLKGSELHPNPFLKSLSITGAAEPRFSHLTPKSYLLLYLGNTISWRGGDWIATFSSETNAGVVFANNTMIGAPRIVGDNPDTASSAKLLVAFAGTVSVLQNAFVKTMAPEQTLASFQFDFSQLSGSLTISENDLVRWEFELSLQFSDHLPFSRFRPIFNRLSWLMLQPRNPACPQRFSTTVFRVHPSPQARRSLFSSFSAMQRHQEQ